MEINNGIKDLKITSSNNILVINTPINAPLIKELIINKYCITFFNNLSFLFIKALNQYSKPLLKSP